MRSASESRRHGNAQICLLVCQDDFTVSGGTLPSGAAALQRIAQRFLQTTQVLAWSAGLRPVNVP